MPKKVLCIDTCGLTYSIALLEDAIIASEYSSNKKHMQCEEIISKIEIMLHSLSISYDDIDMICVTNGPGSFNGVRIGMSAAYGMSIAKNIKLYGISTIDMIFYKSLQAGMLLPISVFFAADSTMGFIKTFYNDGQGIVCNHETPQQITINELESIKHKIIRFDINAFDVVGSGMSNAAAAGMFYIKKYDDSTQTSSLQNLFYGKPPSIHKK